MGIGVPIGLGGQHLHVRHGAASVVDADLVAGRQDHEIALGCPEREVKEDLPHDPLVPLVRHLDRHEHAIDELAAIVVGERDEIAPSHSRGRACAVRASSIRQPTAATARAKKKRQEPLGACLFSFVSRGLHRAGAITCA